jgi:hypothetical protein
MTDQVKFDAALLRLGRALNQLENAVAARLENDLTGAELEEELEIMEDDRSRLALELDAALTRAAIFEKTRDEVLQRLEVVGANVAAVLATPVAASDD